MSLFFLTWLLVGFSVAPAMFIELPDEDALKEIRVKLKIAEATDPCKKLTSFSSRADLENANRICLESLKLFQKLPADEHRNCQNPSEPAICQRDSNSAIKFTWWKLNYECCFEAEFKAGAFTSPRFNPVMSSCVGGIKWKMGDYVPVPKETSTWNPFCNFGNNGNIGGMFGRNSDNKNGDHSTDESDDESGDESDRIYDDDVFADLRKFKNQNPDPSLSPPGRSFQKQDQRFSPGGRSQLGPQDRCLPPPRRSRAPTSKRKEPVSMKILRCLLCKGN